MSVERRSSKAAAWAALLACSGLAIAAGEETPDLEFLEYLGSWEESDKDWELFNGFGVDAIDDEDGEPDETEAAGIAEPPATESTESE